MSRIKQSDAAIVLMNAVNKEAEVLAESNEGRAATKGNLRSQITCRTQGRESVSQAAERIRQAVKRNPKEKLTALMHHITEDTLCWSFYSLKKTAAAGVDGVVWEEYEQGLDSQLADLHRRVHSGAYRALPSRRVNIPKADGGTRPLGIAALEDKIVQKAVVELILEPIYEAQFLGFSHGFRPGRSAHDALDILAYGITERKVNWIVDADIRAFFDRIDRDWLVRFLEHRIGDKRVIRLVIKWLNAGVMESGKWQDNLRGTPQGAIVSPILANVYLHYVLDLWFHRKWRPQAAQGQAMIVRYADDFVVCFQYRQDAQQFMSDLDERLRSFALELHPDKTRLVEFGRYAWHNRETRAQGRPETFDFLGFTHYCRKTRKGGFGLGRKPIAKRVNRTLNRIKVELRRRMHHDVYSVARWLGQVIRDWLGYYAVPTSFSSLNSFVHCVKAIWLKILRRRSQKDRFCGTRLDQVMRACWPPVKILHPWPNQRFAVMHLR